MGIKHPFTSSKTDQSDTTKVRPSIWNSDHVIDSDVDFANNSATNVDAVTATTVNATTANATTVNATDVIVADEAYNQAAWDGELSVPTKNAIRDKIEALVLGGGGVTDFLGLDDTPDSYPGNAGRSVQVNALETALEFGATGVTPRGPTLTISGGAITVTHSFHYVNTEGLVAFDQLDTISGGVDGQRLVLAIANTTRKVHLRNEIGNIVLRNRGDAGFLLQHITSTIELLYDAIQTKWLEISRFGGRAYDGVKNVKDYGAVGNNIIDDTAAIQAAVDDFNPGFDGIYQSNLTVGTILFPAGTYKVTSPIGVTGNASFKFLGEANAVVNGNFNGFIFDVAGGFNKTGHSFEHLKIVNANSTNATSGCIKFNGVVTGAVRSCYISATGGIGVLQASAQDITCDCCAFVGDGIGGAGGIGFCMNNASAAIDCDFTNWSEAAIRAQGLGINIIGGRFEVSETGIQLGLDESGGNNTAVGVHISGLSMESNNIHIHGFSVTGMVIEATVGQSFNAGNTHGLYLISASRVYMNSSGFPGSATSVGSIVLTANADNECFDIVFTNVNGVTWVVPNEINTTAWVNTNYTPAFTNRYNELGQIIIPPSIPVIIGITETIAAGVIPATGNYIIVDTEAAAATDDLDTISGAVGGQHGSRLILRAANNARTVVVKDNTGNLSLSGDFSLDNVQDTISLIWDGDLDKWLELCRSDNGA